MTPEQRQIRIDLVRNISKLRLNLSAVEREDALKLNNDEWRELMADLVNMVDDIVIGIIEMK